MTENRRIFLNIVATYGRSLFALACGLFTGRWLLMSLGEIDYGLFGVVGGLSGFIGFISGLIAAAVGRFYTFAIGQARITGREGLEECRKWFNTAVLLHTVIPVVLMICGYPIGEYAIRNGWIFIPPDRMNACLWVFRFSCLSCFLGLVTVPFNAMYGAKQYIAELTVYSFVTTTLNVCFLYYMVTHPGDWLARYALWGTLLSIAPNLIIAVRAYQLFPECRFRRAYLWDWGRVKALFSYAGAQFFGCFSAMLRQQGIAILVNRYFRATRNADISVANTVAGHCFTLAGCMTGAFAPALTTARGAEDWSRMHGLAFRTCKIGVLLVFLSPTSICSRMTDRTFGMYLYQQGILIAVCLNRNHVQEVPAFFALRPQSVFCAAEEGYLTCFYRLVIRFFVHKPQHQYFLGIIILDYRRNKSVHFFKIKFHILFILLYIILSYINSFAAQVSL